MTRPSCLYDVYNMFTIVPTLGGYSTHHARAFFLFLHPTSSSRQDLRFLSSLDSVVVLSPPK